jgi:hypothetical protein
MRNNLYEIRKIIYTLKRTWGQMLELFNPISQTHNVETGEVDRTYTVHKVKRAVVLPAGMKRDFVYDLSFIASNRNFTAGGFFDENTRDVIVDAKDLPKDTNINLDWHVQFKNKRWEIIAIYQTEDGSSWMLSCKNLSNSVPVNG